MSKIIRQILDNYAKNYVKKESSKHSLMTLPVETFLQWFNTDSPIDQAPTLAQAITIYAKKHFDIDGLELTQYEEALRRCVHIWARHSEYDLYKEIKDITGLNLLNDSSFKFMDELDHIYDLHPDYYYVQQKLYDECGVSSEVSQALCKDVNSYINEPDKYLTIREILDKHGLEDLAYSWFMYKWESGNKQQSDDDKFYKWMHDQLNNDYGLSIDQVKLLVNEISASGYIDE